MSEQQPDRPADTGDLRPPKEREGIFEKVKDFLTGGDDRRHAADGGEPVEEQVQEERVDGLGAHDAVGAAEEEAGDDEAGDGRAGDDRAGDDGGVTGSGGEVVDDAVGEVVDEDAWDGTGEPPEVDIPKSEAVERHLESQEDRDGGGGAGEAPGGSVGAGVQNVDTETVGAETLDTEAVETGNVDTERTDPTAGGEREQRADEHAQEDANRRDRGAEDAREDTDRDSESDTAEDAEDRRRREEEFAREHDPTTHDVAAGEEFRQRGDWTADEHAGPQVQEADGTLHEPDSSGTEESGTDSTGTDSASTDSTGPEESSTDSTGTDSTGTEASQAPVGPRESSIEEVRDGGHGVGSAAPIDGGVMPFGHPVKAWHDTGTFVLPDEPGYDAEPHEWFVDRRTAELAGFRHAHEG